MGIKAEVAEAMGQEGVMFQVAEKVNYKRNLTEKETQIVSVVDDWAKEIGKTGCDPENQIAEFVQRTVGEELYDGADALLDRVFKRGSIGEFDDTEGATKVKNGLVAHEAAKGGVVPRSFVNRELVAPVWKNRQIESTIKYAELRRRGAEAVAELTMRMYEACINTLLYDAFSIADKAVVDGEQVIAVTGKAPTVEAMDALSLYLNDRGSDNVIVTLNKYAQAVRRMDGYAPYLSSGMKEDFNRYGLAREYDGVAIAGVPGVKTGNGSLLIPDKRIYGVADKIGTLDMKGEIHVYQDMNNQAEEVQVMLKDFTYGICLNNIENFAKITLSK